MVVKIMVVQQHILVSICLALLLLESSISKPDSTHLPDSHRQFDADKTTLTRIPPRNQGRVGSRGGGRRVGGRSKPISVSQNCDPLYQYLFRRCGRWPFPRTSPNNPFMYRRGRPRRPPPLPPPLIPSPPPPATSPPPPLVPSPPPPSPSPLVPSPPPPVPSPPLVTLSPPPAYILPPIVPELPGDPFQAPPFVPNPISFSPPAFDINPSPLVPIFPPPQVDPGPIPQLPPLTDPGQQFPPEFDDPGQQFPPFESTTPIPDIIMPPPVDEDPLP